MRLAIVWCGGDRFSSDGDGLGDNSAVEKRSMRIKRRWFHIV